MTNNDGSKHPTRWHHLTIRIKGKEKARIVQDANKTSLGLGAYIRFTLWEAHRRQLKLPPPRPSDIPIVSEASELGAYLRGEVLLQPCGAELCPPGRGADVCFGGSCFCEVCGVRVD
jgi:hypothetical protein